MRNRNKNINSPCRGFTIVEILIVVVVLGILAAVGLPKYGAIIRQTKINTARADMQALKTALYSYYSIADSWPPNSEPAGGLDTLSEWEYVLIVGTIPNTTSSILTSSHNWRGPYISKVPLDPWGNSYIFNAYSYPTDAGNLFKTAIMSKGPDGADSTCVNGAAFSNGMNTCPNHPQDGDGVSIIYNPCNTTGGSSYDIYLWLEK